MAGDDADRTGDDRTCQDHSDPVCSSGGDYTAYFRVYEEEEVDTSGRYEAKLNHKKIIKKE